MGPDMGRMVQIITLRISILWMLLSLVKCMESEQAPTDWWTFFHVEYITYYDVGGRWIRVKVKHPPSSVSFDDVEIEPDTKEVRELFAKNFWLDYPLEDFYNAFSDDPYMSKVIKRGRGLRLMHDLDPEGMFLRAILMQNSTVKQQRDYQRCLMGYFGLKHRFPNAEEILKLDEEKLRRCKLGYRARYLVSAARAIVEGKYNLSQLKELKTKKLREKLMELPGIGPKIADMILVYAFWRRDAFPMDTWIRKALIREYFEGKKQSDIALREFALDYFGKHASIAHIYIWWYERKVRTVIYRSSTI